MSREELVDALHRLKNALGSADPSAEHELRVREIELEMQTRALRDAQVLLEESRARHAELYDAAPIAYFTLDMEGRIREANLMAARLLGFSRDQLVDLPIATLIPADKHGALGAHLRRCFVDGLTATTELPMIVRGRGTARIQLTSLPYQAGVPGPAGRSALSDVTALNRSEERLGLLAEVSQLAGRSFDVAANAVAVARLLVQSFADLCFVDFLAPDGQSLRRVAAEPSSRVNIPSHLAGHFLTAPSPRGGSPIAQVLRSGQPILVESCQPLALTGALAESVERDQLASTCAATSIVFVPLVAHGRVLGALTFAACDAQRRFSTPELAFVVDVAARIGVAADAARLYQQAESAVRARDDLLAVVSHDLRTPLTAIHLAAKSLLLHSPSGPAQRQLEAIVRAGERMEAMVGDLLDLASLEAGQLALAPAPHEVDEILGELVEDLEPLARAKDQVLAIERVGAPASLLCDRRRIVQVLANLVGNAIKFTPRGRAITVGAEVDGERVWFTVADQGPGIPEALRERIFDRFQQGRENRSQGRGLGLYIARGLVESHGGDIGVETSTAGSRFRFWIPRSGPLRTRLAPVPAAHVLIVEPEPRARVAVRDMLEGRGIAVTEAKDGNEALDLLRRPEPRPELILLSLDGGVMDGRQVLEELKKDLGLAAIPVVVVGNDERSADAALRLGARGVVPKPVHAGALLAQVVPKDGVS